MTALACVAAVLALPLRASVASPSIHIVRVDTMGEGDAGKAIAQRVVARLNHGGEIKAAETVTDADATLRGTSRIWETGRFSIDPRSSSDKMVSYQGYLSVELVDKAGRTIWSYLATPRRFRSASIEDDLADQVSARLEAALKGGVLEPGAAGSASQVALRAAGATLPAPLYQKWIQSAGAALTYDAVGSEAGIRQLDAGKVDFAASDMPLTGDSARRWTQIPTVVGAVVPIYNLAGVGQDLKLTPDVLAGIYAGTIRRWNDPQIQNANHGAHLPDAQIAVMHRSDGSGTTFVWTSFLSLVSPEWKSRVGAGARVEWPVGIGAEGNDGMAVAVVKSPNTIGYVELIYAVQHELNFAAVRNPAGQFVKASLDSITAAATDAANGLAEGFQLSILNSPHKDEYPISTFTWLLVPKEGLTAEKQVAVRELLRWMLTAGQRECSSLGYAPLPKEVASRALKLVDAMK